MKKLVLLFAVLSLFAVACSSNTTVDTATVAEEVEDSNPDESTSPTESTAPTESDDAEPQEPEPTAIPEPTATEVPPTPEPADSSPDFSAAVQAVVDADDWCTAAAATEAGMTPLDTLDITDPVQVEQGMRQSLAVVTVSQRLAPPAIAADVAVAAGGFAALIAALEAVDWVFIDLDQDFLQSFGGAQELATYNIEKYNYEQCGIGEDPGAPPTIDDTPDFEDGTVPEGSIRDGVIEQFLAVGFTPEEANCILDNIDFADLESLRDPTILLGVFEECGIPLDRLAQLGGS